MRLCEGAFQVSTRNGQDEPDAEIGNADIIDLCNDSFKKFEQKETINCEGDYVCLVSAKGTMPCDKDEDDDDEDGGKKEKVRVDWRIVKNPEA